jgi:hypothetical protein
MENGKREKRVHIEDAEEEHGVHREEGRIAQAKAYATLLGNYIELKSALRGCEGVC